MKPLEADTTQELRDAWAGARAAKGLRPLKLKSELRHGVSGPVLVRWRGAMYTLWLCDNATWVPAPEPR